MYMYLYIYYIYIQYIYIQYYVHIYIYMYIRHRYNMWGSTDTHKLNKPTRVGAGLGLWGGELEKHLGALKHQGALKEAHGESYLRTAELLLGVVPQLNMIRKSPANSRNQDWMKCPKPNQTLGYCEDHDSCLSCPAGTSGISQGHVTSHHEDCLCSAEKCKCDARSSFKDSPASFNVHLCTDCMRTTVRLTKCSTYRCAVIHTRFSR